MNDVEIREELPADHEGIYGLTEAAFRGKPYADGDEQDVINRLRAAGALLLSLVAIEDGAVIGQVTFSPATLDDGDAAVPWVALGPVSVLPAYQGHGVGAALIVAGLERMKAEGAPGCILTGNPVYYRRFGFDVAGANAPPNEPAETFQLKCFDAASPRGRFAFHPAFYGES